MPHHLILRERTARGVAITPCPPPLGGFPTGKTTGLPGQSRHST